MKRRIEKNTNLIYDHPNLRLHRTGIGITIENLKQKGVDK